VDFEIEFFVFEMKKIQTVEKNVENLSFQMSAFDQARRLAQ